MMESPWQVANRARKPLVEREFAVIDALSPHARALVNERGDPGIERLLSLGYGLDHVRAEVERWAKLFPTASHPQRAASAAMV